jgi:endopeptidase La
MTSDIDNWVNYLNEICMVADVDYNSFNEKSITKDLKLDSIKILKNLIRETKGRKLTNYLANIEKSFKILIKQLKNDKNINEFHKLGFLALSNSLIELLHEVRVKAYRSGKDFDFVEYLDKYEKKLNDLKKKKNAFDKIKENSDSDSEYLPDSEESSEDDEESYADDEEEDEEEEEEEYDDYEEEVVEDNNKRKFLNVRGNKIDSKKRKLDMEFMNSITTAVQPKSYEDQAFSHFTKFDDKDKELFLKKLKDVLESENNTEPHLFKIVNMDLPSEQKNNILTEYMNIENSLSDKSKLKSWLDNVMKLPFGKEKGIDLNNLKDPIQVKNFINTLNKTMDEAVWGHSEAKKKIVEIMVQYISNPESKGNCIGIWGPPGNGKTSLIKEGIAKAMDKSFIFISLGGASDASFLEGHSFTYEGSIYGRIAQGLMKSDCMNPIIYFDELDKISNTHRGQEITNLLVHLTDPVQNSEFMDKYFYNVKLDLSKVTFIFSYNDPSLVDPVLKDRITQVETKYLLLEQKIHIVKNYLLPTILKDVGLKEDSLSLSDEIITTIISQYTLEGGVRKVKSIFYSIVRQLNILSLTNSKLNDRLVKWPFKVTSNCLDVLLKDYVKVDFQKANKDSKVGVINGMWAGSLGIGGILPIESSWIPSKERNYVKATGSLEKVIKESIEVANTLAWNLVDTKNKKKLERRFEDIPFGIHVHCPEGATPKDGPSAGTALTILFYSLYMNKKIKNDVAITGEINLQGKVLEIGGLEEKLQGAKKAGIKTAIIPNSNVKNLLKIMERNPNLIDENFKIIDVEDINEVIKHVFV